jgi:hypothetical protein
MYPLLCVNFGSAGIKASVYFLPVVLVTECERSQVAVFYTKSHDDLMDGSDLIKTRTFMKNIFIG